MQLRPRRLIVRLVLVGVAAFVAFGIILVRGGSELEAAGTFYYPDYQVNIDINTDSTFDVTEKLIYRFDGEFRGVIAQIKLSDPQRDSFCVQNNLTCGGIGTIALMGVYDETGAQLTPDKYELYTETDEDTDISYYTIKWTVWPDGKTFDGNTDFTWSFKYRLYGSLGWLGQAGDQPYFYWNALGEERGGRVESTKVTLNLPTGVKANPDKLEVFNDDGVKYYVTPVANKLVISADDIGATGNFTVAYELPRGVIDQPGTVKINLQQPWVGTRVKLDGVDLGEVTGLFGGVPSGKHTWEFSFAGYETSVVEQDLVSGGYDEINVNLVPGPLMSLALFISGVLNMIGLASVPLAVIWAYNRWRANGRDKQMPSTIIPIFSPPEGIKPYLLGALKDETVDPRDITASIIDLAYRGYIKIKEEKKGSKYELTRLEGKSGDAGLDPVEVGIMDMIFDDKQKVDSDELGIGFLLKYQRVSQQIYDLMVSCDYFKTSPQKTRSRNSGIAILWAFGGMFVLIMFGLIGLPLMGVFGPGLLGLGMIAAGIAIGVTAKYMPAKTPEGSRVYAQVLGFRMYMYTAERYRVQGLNPDEFEKYLSYAIAFEIENRWADEFKDIYTGQPEWLDGDVNMMRDTRWVAGFGRGFVMGVTQHTFSTGTGSARGSGWSGGGSSFGGFSGGGGGGGSRGAF